jgi:hypothetical protein
MYVSSRDPRCATTTSDHIGHQLYDHVSVHNSESDERSKLALLWRRSQCRIIHGTTSDEARALATKYRCLCRISARESTCMAWVLRCQYIVGDIIKYLIAIFIS